MLIFVVRAAREKYFTPDLSGVDGLKTSLKNEVVRFAYAGESIKERTIDVKLDGNMLSAKPAFSCALLSGLLVNIGELKE